MWNEQAQDSLNWEALVLAVLNLLDVMKAYLQSSLTRKNGGKCGHLHLPGYSPLQKGQIPHYWLNSTLGGPQS